jgi:hypothetical protein
MFRPLGNLVKRLRAWARSGSAATTSRDALDARRKAENDMGQHGGWR